MKTKKELKEAYKQMKFTMGIFQIRNTVNGRLYIDNSVNLDAIWNRHRTQLKFGMHPNTLLQKEWTEMGEESFQYEILSVLQPRGDGPADYTRELKQLEEMYKEELKPFGEKGYHSAR